MQTSPTGTPFRPPNEKDVLLLANGRAVFLGVIRSTGAAVDNSTTLAPAPPFSFTPVSAPPPGSVDSPSNMAGTLAAKMLLVQATAAGLVRSSRTAIGAQGTLNVAAQSLPIAQGTEPGILLSTVPVELMHTPLDGFLQWISSTGTADLYVWELT